jgi:hypothetical protein
MSGQARDFYRLVKHPFQFRLYLLFNIPSAFFSGIRIKQIDEGGCIVSVPYQWFSKNPFRSTYFACLAMAAEMFTGALPMALLKKKTPPVSMLVIHMEAEYFKKATSRTIFICKDGAQIKETIHNAIASGLAQTFAATATGHNEKGEKIAVFKFTWSFKVKR